jgi:hypothetical protein
VIKLNTSYSKKIPVEGQDFSSQSFHASVELELSDNLSPEQIKARIHDTATLLRRSVDDELHGGQAATPAPAYQQGFGQPRSNQRTQPQGNERKASNKQIKFITDLAAEQKILLSDLNADIRTRFNVEGLYDLSSKQASALLDEMNAGGRRQRAA